MLKKIVSHPVSIFSAIAILFYWPLTFQLFSLKNDALTYYYPVRALISDALRNQELPLWTPFINFGYPLHADMQSGAWNPVVWLTSFISGYSLAGFHYELIFYLIIAGFGMFKLACNFEFDRRVAIICGICYECCGCFTDSIQFVACFSSAAYLPWILFFFRRTMHSNSLKNSLGMGFTLSLLFTGGYPSMFIICLYVLLAYTLWFFVISRNRIFLFKQFLRAAFVSVIAFTLLSLPAIVSFLQHLAQIDRGSSQDLSFVLENSMHPADTISLLAPFLITGKNVWLSSSPIMRNIYFGLIPALMLGYTFRHRKVANREIYFVASMSVILLLLAWGNFFFLRQLAYYSLPLMDSFRHPALFRIFSVIFFIIVAGTGLQHLFVDNKTARRFPGAVILTLAGIALIAGLIAITFFPSVFSPQIFRKSLTEMHITTKILLQSCALLVVCITSYFVLNRKINLTALTFVIVFDLFLAVQMQLPVTVIGARTFSDVEAAMNRNPEPFPLAGSELIQDNISNSSGASVITGSTLPFTKKIGRDSFYISPGNLKDQDKFYESRYRDMVLKKPVLYLENALAHDSIKMLRLSANAMTAISDNAKRVTAVYLQNYYPGWKVFVDGNPAEITIIANTFMRFGVPAGQHSIRFIYQPFGIKPAAYLFILGFLTFIALYGFLFFAERRAEKRQTEI